jgi:polysaccharide deacetylase family protein (PEP-CTERM system associated)
LWLFVDASGRRGGEPGPRGLLWSVRAGAGSAFRDPRLVFSHHGFAREGNMSRAELTPSIFSVDVEDWFHISDLPSTPPLSCWDGLPSLVEKNFHRLLDIFAECGVHVTCFFLGWVGERFPQLVRRAHEDGHEVASHGYGHGLLYEIGRESFYQDALRARKLLEDISGAQVLGYRAPGFSACRETPWFFETLAAAGYQYDSSVFPAKRTFGGFSGYRREPHQAGGNNAKMLEFPVSITNLLGHPLCFFGGGYLRLFPYWLIRRQAKHVLSEGRPVIFYIHPREIDPDHPRLPMRMRRRFNSYVNLATTEPKLRRIFLEFPTTTFRDYLNFNAQSLEIPHAGTQSHASIL